MSGTSVGAWRLFVKLKFTRKRLGSQCLRPIQFGFETDIWPICQPNGQIEARPRRMPAGLEPGAQKKSVARLRPYGLDAARRFESADMPGLSPRSAATANGRGNQQNRQRHSQQPQDDVPNFTGPFG
jgi:hypothetical protein